MRFFDAQIQIIQDFHAKPYEIDACISFEIILKYSVNKNVIPPSFAFIKILWKIDEIFTLRSLF